ncbi:hypothetical protein RhiirA5_350487, partial [Rhizophagus irregularis]
MYTLKEIKEIAFSIAIIFFFDPFALLAKIVKMENKIDIFENYILEETQFENPLENKFFLYYL